MLTFLLGMSAGVVIVLIVVYADIVINDRKDKKLLESRKRSVFHERINVVHDRVDRLTDRVKNLEMAAELLNKRGDCGLEYIDACIEEHEAEFHPKEGKK